MSIFSIGEFLSTFAESAMLFLLFETFLTRRREVIRWVLPVAVIAVAFLFLLCNRYFLWTLGNIAGMFLVGLLASFLYQGAIRMKILAIILMISISAVSEIVVLYAITFVLHMNVADAVTIPEYRFLGILLSKTLGVAICNIIRVRFKLKQSEIKLAYLGLFAFLFANAVLIVFLLFRMTYALQDAYFNDLSVVASFALFASVFFSLYLYEYLTKQNQIIRYQEQAEQQMRFQLQHMDETILSQNKLRAMRHDMNSHLIALKSFFDARDFKGGSRYIENLDAQFQQAALSVNTGNNALDSVLSAKRSLAESKDVAFHTKIKIQENLPIAPEDCSIIFGNALDNAIEACERLPADAEKSINLFLQQDATTIFCKITNTALPNTEKTFLTSKADKVNHGFGIKNIKEALEKYPSLFSFEQKDGQFVFSFSIFY